MEGISCTAYSRKGSSRSQWLRMCTHIWWGGKGLGVHFQKGIAFFKYIFLYIFVLQTSSLKEKWVICLGGFTSSAAALKFSDSVEVLRYDDGLIDKQCDCLKWSGVHLFVKLWAGYGMSIHHCFYNYEHALYSRHLCSTCLSCLEKQSIVCDY